MKWNSFFLSIIWLIITTFIPYLNRIMLKTSRSNSCRFPLSPKVTFWINEKYRQQRCSIYLPFMKVSIGMITYGWSIYYFLRIPIQIHFFWYSLLPMNNILAYEFVLIIILFSLWLQRLALARKLQLSLSMSSKLWITLIYDMLFLYWFWFFIYILESMLHTSLTTFFFIWICIVSLVRVWYTTFLQECTFYSTASSFCTPGSFCALSCANSSSYSIL